MVTAGDMGESASEFLVLSIIQYLLAGLRDEVADPKVQNLFESCKTSCFRDGLAQKVAQRDTFGAVLGLA